MNSKKASTLLLKLLKAPNEREIRIVQLICHLLFFYSLFTQPWLWMGGVLWGWLIAGFGGVLIGHRYVAHKQFLFPNNMVKGFFYFLYNLNTIGSGVNYASIHWLHHKHSDDIEKDPTTWKRTGLLATHFTFYGYSFAGKLNIKLYKALMKDPMNRFFHRYYYLPHILVALIGFAFGGLPLVIAFVAVPSVVSFHIAQLQVGVLHVDLPLSYRNYPTLEAYNIPWLKPLLYGEELHNNHHANPNSPNRSEHESEFDPLYRFLIKPFFRSSREIL